MPWSRRRLHVQVPAASQAAADAGGRELAALPLGATLALGGVVVLQHQGLTHVVPAVVVVVRMLITSVVGWSWRRWR